MKILVVSNLYPPPIVGGYELGCQDVVDGLRRFGHQVVVLTVADNQGPRESADESEAEVLRCLRGCLPVLPSARRYVLAAIKKTFLNLRLLRRVISETDSDIVYFWNLAGLSKMLTQLPGRMGIPVGFYIFDEWPTRFTDEYESILATASSGGARAMAKQVLRKFFQLAYGLDQKRICGDVAQYASHYLKARCAPSISGIRHSAVIPFGIDLSRYLFSPPRPALKKLLYVGQIARHKGVHTAIDAFAGLLRSGGGNDLSLSVVGGVRDQAYVDELRELVSARGLSGRVSFCGERSRTELAAVYREHDALVFPSEWAEPFGLVALESMASGLAIVATGTGGAGEILRHERNALLFAPGDAAGCMEQIRRLCENIELRRRLSECARKDVEKNYDLRRVIAAIADDLEALAEGQYHAHLG